MKKIITLIICFILIFSIVSCNSKSNTITPSTDDAPSKTIPSDITISDTTATEDDELMNKTIVFKIGNTEVDVY